ncbi:hypothetical protein LCGC14_2218620, partial [marine sediment metagenome]
CNKKQLEKGITLKMTKEIKKHLNDFISKTHDRYIARYLNGFLGIGILNTPTDHIIKGVNTILFFQIGYNEEGTDIIVISKDMMTLEEAEDTYRIFGECIKKYKKLNRKYKKEV